MKKSNLILHAVVLKKPKYKSKDEALKEAYHLFPKEKVKKFVRETPSSFRFRVVPKTKFKKTEYKSKKFNKDITAVFGKLKGGAKRIPKEPDPELTITPEQYKKMEGYLTIFKSYQLKDLIRQFVEKTNKNISYKIATKKRLIDLVIRHKINPLDYIIVEKNPVVRVPANVLKRYGLKQNTDEEQQKLIEEMESVNPLKARAEYTTKEGTKELLTLQKHQEDFIKQFVFSQLRGAVVYHGVGSGKTLTAVVSSYFYLTLYPNNKVIVISPSALLYNFINGMVQYGLNIQDKRYTFLTYEKYDRNYLIYEKYMENTLLIIDEAHNFRTEIIQQHIKDPETGDTLETTVKTNKKGYKLLINGGLKAHKILALTGTAFVNTIYDIENLLAFVDKRYPLDKTTYFEIVATPTNLSEYFKHRISYFPTQKSDFFPEKRDKIIGIYMDEDQEAEYNELKLTGNPNSKRGESENPNAYFSAERYATNAIQLENNPKINKIAKLLKEQPEQKFIIYTVAQDAGIKLLEKKLGQLKIEYKIISGTQSTIQKEESKKYFNGYFNNKIPKSTDPNLAPYINDKYRVLLITKAGAEGVDTSNCQNIILLDHQWNDATTEQIIARAIRFKSHFALPVSERYVNVYYLLFCFLKEKPIVDKIRQNGFNDWVNVKNELNADSEEYKQTSLLITKVKNKGLLLQKQFIENEKLKNADVKELYNYLVKILEKVRIYIIELLPKLEDNIERNIKSILEEEDRKIKDAVKIEKNKLFIHHPAVKAFRKSKKAYTEEINYYEKIKDYVFNISESTTNFINKTEGYGDLEQPTKGSIDLYLFLLAKSKLKNINEFILNFGGNIELFEKYESRLLPIIKKAEEEYIKKHKRGLTDKEQIDIYKEALQKEKDAVLDFNFSIDPKRIIAKAGRGEEDKYQQFYTSELLAEKIKTLGLKGLKGNLDILEPSAGFGNLIKPLVKLLNTEFHIDMIDIDERNRIELKKLVDTAPNILNLLDNKNFLTFGTGKRYDLILMNPPFHLKGKENSLIKDVYDYDFVDRSFALLKEGGRIVAITSTKWSFDKGWDRFELFNDAPQDYLNMEMKTKKKVSGESSYLKYEIERLEDEPFLGSEGKKIKMTVDIFVIEKLSQEKDSLILGKTFYLSQTQRGKALEDVDIDFDVEKSLPPPPPPVQAPIEEIIEPPKVKSPKVKPEPPKPEPEPEPDNYDKISQELQRLILITSIDKIKKALVEMNFKGRIETQKIRLSMQILQNFKSIEMMKKLINLLKEEKKPEAPKEPEKPFIPIRISNPEIEPVVIPEEPIIKEPEKIVNKLEDKIKEFERVGKENGAVIYSSETFIQTVAYIALLMEYGSKCVILDKNIDTIDINAKEKSPMNFNLFKNAERLSKDLLDCIKRGEKIIAMPLSLKFGTSRTGHANMLIYRPEKRTIERFEPHGKTFQQGGKDDNTFNKILKRMFEDEMKPYLKEYTPKFITPAEVCPNPKGFQALEGQIKKLSQEGGGFCGMWSLFCLEMMFINPTKTTPEIMDEAFKITQADPLYLSNVIRGYVIKIEKLLDNYVKKIDANDGFSFKKGTNLSSKKSKVQEQLLSLLLSFGNENTSIEGLKEAVGKSKEREDKYKDIKKLLSNQSNQNLNKLIKSITGKDFGSRTINKLSNETIVKWIIDNILERPLSYTGAEEKIFKYYGIIKKGAGRGGAINTSELKKFVDAGYKNKREAQNIDGYVLDTELSTKRDKVYYDPKTGKAVHTIAGTDKLKDWSNNLLIPFGLHTQTNRYKNAEKIQKKANEKYGKENLSLVSHSQSGNIADNLAKKGLVGDENISLNPAIIGKHNKNLKVVKSSLDPVSLLTKTNKKDEIIKSKSYNPLVNHSTKILGKGREKQLIKKGKMIYIN